MSTPAAALPTENKQWKYPISEIKSSSDYQNFLYVPPTSTIKISDYFKKLVDEWNRDTGHLSLISERVEHPAYKRIVRMGSTAIPLILEELKRAPGHWFHALITLADDNPVPPDFNGTVEDAAALWVAWGQDQHLIDF